MPPLEQRGAGQVEHRLKLPDAPMLFALRTTRTRGSRAAYSAQIHGVSSLDALSARMSSKSDIVCASRESTASRRYRAPL